MNSSRSLIFSQSVNSLGNKIDTLINTAALCDKKLKKNPKCIYRDIIYLRYVLYVLYDILYIFRICMYIYNIYVCISIIYICTM